MARCTIEWLMKAQGLRGIPRETTIGDGAETERPEDLMKRKFIATGPNQLICYTERLAEAEAVASVGSSGDSYDNNPMAEALNSLFKAECVHNPVMRPKGG